MAGQTGQHSVGHTVTDPSDGLPAQTTAQYNVEKMIIRCHTVDLREKA